MGGTQNQSLTPLSKKLFDLLLNREIVIIAGYLLGLLTKKAVTQSTQ